MGERMTVQTYPGSRILLVEDSDDLRSLMVLILESEGYSVDSAATAEEGLRLLNSGSYDLVLSDYALPGRTGAWMLREALARPVRFAWLQVGSTISNRSHGMAVHVSVCPCP